MKKLTIKRFIPGYAIIPLLLMVIVNMITYYGTQLFTNDMYHYNISSTLDDRIPLIPVFIIPYVLAYIQWVLGYILIAKDSKKLCYWIIDAELIAKVVTMIIFMVFPTTLIRPDVNSTSILSTLIRFIYHVDIATNLFPSIHCLESFLVLIGTLKMKDVNPIYKWVTIVMTILVFLSTIFIKQHVIVDMLGAVVIALIALYISKQIVRRELHV